LNTQTQDSTEKPSRIDLSNEDSAHTTQ